jgi:L-asparaginase
LFNIIDFLEVRMMKKRILALITGGTFDKEYNMMDGQLFFNNSHLPDILDRGRSRLDITVKTLMMMDSLEMTTKERDIILDNCKNSDFKHIIITHGTDTMVKTAQHLIEGDIGDRTIVMTGAMIPYTFGMSSDGFFNLGSGLAFVQTLPPGVYIAMHGEYFNWDNVFKNKATGYFERLDNDRM